MNGALNRRAALAGMATMAAIGAGIAAPALPAIARGALANNAIAQAFQTAPANLPQVDVQGADGTTDVSNLLQGRTVLMPLWAEWCAPCLSEIPDFAKLQQKFGNSKFAIIPVLTGTQRKWTPDALKQLFGILHAGVFAPLFEGRSGSKLFRAMARIQNHVELPCNLLIGPDGKVLGREMGRLTADDATAGAAPAANRDPETVRRAVAGQAQSIWGKAPGEEFAAAMANGFLG